MRIGKLADDLPAMVIDDAPNFGILVHLPSGVVLSFRKILKYIADFVKAVEGAALRRTPDEILSCEMIHQVLTRADADVLTPKFPSVGESRDLSFLARIRFQQTKVYRS